MARQASIVSFARQLVRGVSPRDRLGRVACLFTFVGVLVDAPTLRGRHGGTDALLALAGARDGPAVILAALLQALGERAQLEYTREIVFVRVELDASDLARLPPYAAPILRPGRRGRFLLPLDPRRARGPLGFLPRPVREALDRRLTA